MTVIDTPPVPGAGIERPLFNVLDYGADPSGTRDSTTAIQSAINAMNVNSGGEVYFPAGLYKISASLNLQNRNNVWIRGAGPGLPPNVFVGPISATSFRWVGAPSGVLWDCRGMTHGHFSNFGCDSNSIAGLTCFLFDGNPTFNASNNCFFENLSIGDTNSGWATCMKIGNTVNTQVSEFTILACRFYLYTTFGIQINSANALDIWIMGCQFQDQISGSVGAGTGIELTSGSFHAFGCSFLNNALDVNIGIMAQAVVLCGFDAEQSNKFLAVGANCAGPLTIDSGNISCTGSGAGANAITIASIAANGSISLRQLAVLAGKNIDVAVGFAQKLLVENVTFVGGGAFTTNSFYGVLQGGLRVQNALGGNFSIINPSASGILTLDGADASSSVWIRPDGTVAYKFGKTAVTAFAGVNTLGFGLPAIYGLDNRSGLTAVDGAPITLYAVPAGAGKLFRITADIFATAFTSGTATYTITWTENAVTRTLVVTATAINTLGTGTDLINPDASTNITAQLTGVFTATVKVSAVVEQLA